MSQPIVSSPPLLLRSRSRRRAFIEGLASVVDLFWGSLPPRPLTEAEGAAADWWAIAADWQSVGDDLAAVMGDADAILADGANGVSSGDAAAD